MSKRPGKVTIFTAKKIILLVDGDPLENLKLFNDPENKLGKGN
jgi:hypothetical protein